MPAPVLQAQGAIASVSTGNLAITLPAYTTDDIVVITTVGWVPNTTTGTNTQSLASPWTKYSPNVTTITSSIIDAEYAFWWARATSSSSLGTSVTITRPTNWDTGNDTCWAGRAYTIRGCPTSGDPYDQLTVSSIYTAANQNIPAVTVNGVDRLVIAFLAIADNLSAGAAPSTWTAGTADTTTTGTDAGFQTFYKTSSTSTTATATSVVAPAQGGYVFFVASFEPPPAAVIQRTATGSGTSTQIGNLRRQSTASGSGLGTQTALGGKKVTRTATGSGLGTQTTLSGKKTGRTGRGIGNSEYIANYSAEDYGLTQFYQLAMHNGTTTEYGTSFTAIRNTDVTAASFYIARSGSPTGNVTARIYTHTGTFGSTGVPGTLLATSTAVDISTISTTTSWVRFVFPSGSRASLTSGTNYFVVLEYSGGDGSNRLLFGMENLRMGHPGKGALRSGAGAWSVEANQWELLFRVEGVSAPWANRTVLVTTSRVTSGTFQAGNWTNSAGNTTNMYTYVDESYASPDGLYVRGSTDVSDTTTTNALRFLIGNYSTSSPVVSRMRSARVRFRLRAPNLVDDTVTLHFAITSSGEATTYAGAAAGTRQTIVVSSNTYIDTGWINFNYVNPNEVTGSTGLFLSLAQEIVVNGGTPDGTYIDIDTLEVETTVTKRYSQSVRYGALADSISRYVYVNGQATSGFSLSSTGQLAQSQNFTARTSGTLIEATVRLYKNTGATGDVYGYLYGANVTTGAPETLLATATPVPISNFSTVPSSIKFSFPNDQRPTLTEGSKYNLVVYHPTSVSGSSLAVDRTLRNGISAQDGIGNTYQAVSPSSAWSVGETANNFVFTVIKATAKPRLVQKTATGSGLGTATAPCVNRTVKITYTRVPISTLQAGNWLNSAGNTTNMYTYVDESYASPDGLFVRGAADTTDTSTGGLKFGMGLIGTATFSSRMQSAKVRFRLRVVNRVDDDVTLGFNLTSAFISNNFAGQTSTTDMSLAVTSSTYVDSGWIDFVYINPTVVKDRNLYLNLFQSVTVNGGTPDGAYIEIDAIEVQFTVAARYMRGAGYTSVADTISRLVVPSVSDQANNSNNYGSRSNYFSAAVKAQAQNFTARTSGFLFEGSADLIRQAGATGDVSVYLYTGNATTGNPETLIATANDILLSNIPTTSTSPFTKFTFPAGQRPFITEGSKYSLVLYHPTSVSGSAITWGGSLNNPSWGDGLGNSVYTATFPTVTWTLDSATNNFRFTLTKATAKSGKISVTATGSGTGTQTATRRRTPRRSATGSGTGTQTAQRKITPKRTATGSGLSTQTALGARAVKRTATGSGTSTSTNTIKRKRFSNAFGSGGATTGDTATWNINPVRQATGSGISAQTAGWLLCPLNGYDLCETYDFIGRSYNGGYVTYYTRTATGSGTGTQGATWSPKIAKAATGSGTGSSTPATFIRNRRRTASGAGTGTQNAIRVRHPVRTATGSGTGTQTGSGFKTRYRAATGSGTGTSTASFRRIRLRTAAGSGTGTSTTTYKRNRRRAATGSGLGTQSVSNNFSKRYRTASGSGVGNHFISTLHNNIRTAQGLGGATTGDQAIGLHTAPRTAVGSGLSIENPYDNPQKYDDFRLKYDQYPGITTFIRLHRRVSTGTGNGASTNTQRQAKGFLRTSTSAGTGTAVVYVYFATPVSRTASSNGQGTQTDINVTLSTTHGIGAGYWGIPALVG